MKTTHNLAQGGESPINTEARFPRWSYAVTMTEGHDQFPDRIILRFMQQIVADVPHDEGTEQLFAEICLAVNSHDQLVQALGRAVDAMTIIEKSGALKGAYFIQEIIRANAALAAAKGEE